MIYRLENFFDATDINDVRHNGFIASLALPSMPVLNAITVSILDDFIFNQIGKKLALSQWTKFFDAEKIDPSFYTKATSTLQAFLIRSDKLYELSEYDFRSLSANEIETLVYGAESESYSFGAKSETDNYGQIRITLTRGNDTTTAGARSDSTTVSSDTDTTTDSTYPFDASAFQPKAKSEFAKGDETTETSIGSQTTTQTFGDSTSTTAARSDSKSEAARTDGKTKQSHTDTKTTSRVVIISPEKYFEIMKELTEIDAYNILRDSVDECFCLNNF